MLRESLKVHFFIVQCANLRLLETYDKFLTNLCDVNKIEAMEVVTDFVYLALCFLALRFRPETLKLLCNSTYGYQIMDITNLP